MAGAGELEFWTDLVSSNEAALRNADYLGLIYSVFPDARLIAHWRKVLPTGTLLDVPYEELVRDQELWTRKILAFPGLEWNVSCLRFNETPRPVVTSSSWQVRQRKYGDSIERWRHYSKFVGPLRTLYRA